MLNKKYFRDELENIFRCEQKASCPLCLRDVTKALTEQIIESYDEENFYSFQRGKAITRIMNADFGTRACPAVAKYIMSSKKYDSHGNLRTGME